MGQSGSTDFLHSDAILTSQVSMLKFNVHGGAAQAGRIDCRVSKPSVSPCTVEAHVFAHGTPREIHDLQAQRIPSLLRHMRNRLHVSDDVGRNGQRSANRKIATSTPERSVICQ